MPIKLLREGRLTALEAGALSALDRYGQRQGVAHDAASAARVAILERLAVAGLVEAVGPPAEREFVITEAGRAALAAMDQRPRPGAADPQGRKSRG